MSPLFKEQHTSDNYFNHVLYVNIPLFEYRSNYEAWGFDYRNLIWNQLMRKLAK